MKTNERMYTAAGVAAVYEEIKQRRVRRACSYRVQIDGVTVIKRTYDLRKFYGYFDHVGENSQRITFRIYGAFRPVSEHEFILAGEVSEKVLNETTVRVDKLAYDAMQREQSKMFAELLDKDLELQTLREQLAAAKQKPASEPIEKLNSAKVIDAGDSLVIITSKKEMRRQVGEQINALCGRESLLDKLLSVFKIR